MTGEPEGLTAVLLQLAGLTQTALRTGRAPGRRHPRSGQPHRRGRCTGQPAPGHHGQPHPGASRPRRPGPAARQPGRHRRPGPARQAPRTRTSRRRRRSSGRLDGPARDAAIGKLRAWVEQVYRPGYGHLAASSGGLLGAAPAVPVRPGLAVRAVVGALPRARRARRGRWPARPNGTPGCWPPRPSSSPGKPAAAPTALPRYRTAGTGARP